MTLIQKDLTIFCINLLPNW